MIRKISCLFFVVAAAAMSNVAFAEETGTGKPKNSTTQQTSATTDCSWIETMLGRCATSEDDGEDTGVVSE